MQRVKIIPLAESIKQGFITGDQVTSAADMENFFERAQQHIQAVRQDKRILTLRGRRIARVFYEASTRTKESFGEAIWRLGAKDILLDVNSSSVVKNETLEHTSAALHLTHGGHLDAIVQRHSDPHAAAQLQRYFQEMRDAQTNGLDLGIPNHWPIVINAGSGAGEHPTQAMLDALTISEWLKAQKRTWEGLRIVIAGDLKHGRTIHSLLKVLAVFPDIHLTLVSPAALGLPDEYLDSRAFADIKKTESLDPELPTADIVYMTRIQKERFADEEEALRLKGQIRLNSSNARLLPENSIMMHPLPSDGELDPALDRDPRQRWFAQMWYGVAARMTLLEMALAE